MRGHNVCLYGEIRSIIHKLSLLPLIWSTGEIEIIYSVPFNILSSVRKFHFRFLVFRFVKVSILEMMENDR